ncbi:hypothetical protein HFZ77_01405 [Thalassovita gelatinovora]|nr:hypothetical protein HFZ77_01405 [Thalassovita gelatinovora]
MPIVRLLCCSKCYQRSGIKPRQVHTVIGGNGNDTVSTGLGDDLVHLGDGYNLWREDDTASYDPGLMSDNDTVEGGFAEPGYHNSDYLISRFGSDSLSGYGGNDNISALDYEHDNTGTSLENAPDTLNGGSGDDRLYADDGDQITAGDGADEIYINVETDPREGDAEPVVITDFNTDEDVLIVTGNTFDASVVRTVAVPESNGYTLTAHGVPFAVLENVSADDIGTIDFRVYRF